MKLAYNSDFFRTMTDQSEVIGEWRPKHSRLIEVLSTVGTLVRVVTVNEVRLDTAQFAFVRQATHEFIFPPQPVVLKEDLSAKAIDATQGYSIYKKHEVYEVADPTAIKGVIRVCYSDADSRVGFSVYDVYDGESEFPKEALSAIAATELQEIVPIRGGGAEM